MQCSLRTGNLAVSPLLQQGVLTGITLYTAELAAKRLQILRELAPTAGVIALYSQPSPNNGSVRF